MFHHTRQWFYWPFVRWNQHSWQTPHKGPVNIIYSFVGSWLSRQYLSVIWDQYYAICVFIILLLFNTRAHEKKIGHRDCSRWAHSELTVTKMVTASRDWAVTWAVIELWSSRDWAVIILKMPWLSCDLAVTELWPSRDWVVTSPSHDHWARSRDHRELTVSSRWAHGYNFFLMGHMLMCKINA